MTTRSSIQPPEWKATDHVRCQSVRGIIPQIVMEVAGENEDGELRTQVPKEQRGVTRGLGRRQLEGGRVLVSWHKFRRSFVPAPG